MDEFESQNEVEPEATGADGAADPSAPNDRRIALLLAGAFALVAAAMLMGWGWGVPAWSDLPSVQLDLLLHGREATLAIRAEATIKTDDTNQVAIFHDSNEWQYMEGYPLSSTLTLDALPIYPGLANTRSWDSNANSALMSQSMVPQGLALSDDWVFASAYDGNHDVNSVLYLIDRATGELARTVVLVGQPHAGGVAWDEDHERVWVCSRRNDQAQLVGIKLDELLARDADDASPITYDTTCIVDGPKRASFVEYFQGSLYVGYFDSKKNGRLYRYLLDEEGKLVQEQRLLQEGDKAYPIESWELPPRAQGVAFTDEYVILSLSHGNRDSELMFFERDTRYDHVASLPVHGGKPVYGAPPEAAGGAGAGSAGSAGAAGPAGAGSAAAGSAAGSEGPASPLESFGEWFQSLLGGPRSAGSAAQGSAAAQKLEHAPFVQGLEVMAADRAAIVGSMAFGMAGQAAITASSDLHHEPVVISYAEDPLLVAMLPRMMEDITIRDGMLFAVHESGSALYRVRYGVGVDRVVSYPFELFTQAMETGGQGITLVFGESATDESGQAPSYGSYDGSSGDAPAAADSEGGDAE